MAFEDGLNKRVTIERRAPGGPETWVAVGSDVEVRVTSLKLAEIQAAGETLDMRVSHNLVAPVDADIQEGDRLRVTATRRAGGEWSPASGSDVHAVVLIEPAEGGAQGPHHLRGMLSRMAGTT